ncbi:MAG: hypothetical protein AB1414_12600 [bacterium]
MMKYKLIGILVIIFGYISPSGAQDYSSLGKSVYSSKFYGSKYSQGKKKTTSLKSTEQSSGLLYERGTSTLRGGTHTPTGLLLYKYAKKTEPVPYVPISKVATSTLTYTTTDYATAERLKVEEPMFSPWLGQSIYKKLSEQDKDDTPAYYSPTERKNDYYQRYYSNIFYKGKNPPDKKGSVK